MGTSTERLLPLPLLLLLLTAAVRQAAAAQAQVEDSIEGCRTADDAVYAPGANVTYNCWQCMCGGEYWTRCVDRQSGRPIHLRRLGQRRDPELACLVKSNLIRTVNADPKLNWVASNHSRFWATDAASGYSALTGTVRPSRIYLFTNTLSGQQRRQAVRHGLRWDSFDAEQRRGRRAQLPRAFVCYQKWPRVNTAFEQQPHCASGLKLAATSVYVDRLSIKYGRPPARGNVARQLFECDKEPYDDLCKPATLERTWYYLQQEQNCTAEVFPGLDWSAGPQIKETYLLTQEKAIMEEIYERGPVLASLFVYDSLLVYSSGVYEHVPDWDNRLQLNWRPHSYDQHYHTVKIVGWGTAPDKSGDEVPYWLCENTWGSDWGERGYFKIRRGSNECWIESFVIGIRL